MLQQRPPPTCLTRNCIDHCPQPSCVHEFPPPVRQVTPQPHPATRWRVWVQRALWTTACVCLEHARRRRRTVMGPGWGRRLRLPPRRDTPSPQSRRPSRRCEPGTRALPREAQFCHTSCRRRRTAQSRVVAHSARLAARQEPPTHPSLPSRRGRLLSAGRAVQRPSYFERVQGIRLRSQPSRRLGRGRRAR